MHPRVLLQALQNTKSDAKLAEAIDTFVGDINAKVNEHEPLLHVVLKTASLGWPSKEHNQLFPLSLAALARRKDYNIEAPGYESRTALHVAAQRHGELVLALLSFFPHVDVRARQKDTHLTALHYAHDTVTVAALLKAGADPDALDYRGHTPLFWAASRGVAHRFLAACPVWPGNVDARSGKDGITALMYAYSPADVQALLDAGANPDLRCTDSRFVHWKSVPCLRTIVQEHIAWTASDRCAWIRACVRAC